ncbi:MAG: acyl carrier protein [Bacilli bacterium]|nr:acyl carrier protein [Bacilli bacterium]
MLDKLKELIVDVMPEIDTLGITEETKLIEDLRFDSLGIMMLAMAIEDEFNIEFSEAPTFITVGDVIKYIESKMK